MWRAITFTATLCGAMMAAGAASAQMACADHSEVTGNLRQQFQESRMGMGLTLTGQLVEVFAGDSGTWTILLVSPDGTACSLSAGQNWVWVEKGPRPAANRRTGKRRPLAAPQPGPTGISGTQQ